MVDGSVMQIFSVEFYFNYKGDLVQDVTATLTFEVDTFSDLWMQLELGESCLLYTSPSPRDRG